MASQEFPSGAVRLCMDTAVEEERRPSTPLLLAHGETPQITPFGRPSLPVRKKLYLSHFLSAWNSRVFEFGAVLFLSTIFPGTLLPASLYALARAASVIVFSGFIGRFIDSAERIHVVRVSIVGQRIATALSCLILWFLVARGSIPRSMAHTSLAVLSLLACVEKLNSVMNTIAIERDWVPTIAESNERDMSELNSQMRRIDLFCKLVGPLAIALIDGYSTRIAILVTLGMTCASVGVEYLAIARVYLQISALHRRAGTTSNLPGIPQSEPHSVTQTIMDGCMRVSYDIHLYITHAAFLPSFALSLLYLTTFSFGGQLITYLLSLSLSSTVIGLLRTLSTVFELSATWLAPRVMSRIGAIRAGIWFLNWQILCVGVAVAALWMPSTTVSPAYTVAALLIGVILSRVGLWGFDLSAQIIVQESVAENDRGTFSAMEASVQSFFEMLSFASTVVFAKPSQFRFPGAVSAGAVVTAGVLYAYFVRLRRGHLFHASKCLKTRQQKGARGQYERVSEGEEEIASDAGSPSRDQES